MKKHVWLAIIASALGFFVDLYDIIILSIVRSKSLLAVGVPESELLSKGVSLINIQMVGMLIGGFVWGIIGDKMGRLSVLFGSIILYSSATFANAYANSFEMYLMLRFLAGIGLAGELGAGITLVSESLPTKLRGYGTTLVATVGLMGAVLANYVAKTFDWQMAYFIGGGLGLILLVTRISVFESGIFMKVKEQGIERGNFLQLFNQWARFKKFIGCILIGLPIWFVIGILITFSPEFAKAMGIAGVVAGDAVMYSYIGLAAGDLLSGVASQAVRSRKKTVFVFILLTLVFITAYLYWPFQTSTGFYVGCFFLGLGVGYWALFVTIAAEQFGTNLRSTAATTVPNFIRGSVVPLTFMFGYLRENLNILQAALIVGVFTIMIAFWALRLIDETFSRDLNYVEKDH